jgi:hypothetical protein
MLPKLLCDICALKTGILSPSWNILTNNYTGEYYQFDKFSDHTITGHRVGSNPP